jgi:hypothetical protein
MQDKLQEQFEKVLTNETGTYYEMTKRIYDFIDQNFIGKEEVRKGLEELPEVILNNAPYVRKLLEQLK